MRLAVLCILVLRSVTFAMTETSLVPPPRSIDLTGESFTIDVETVILVETGRDDLRARVFLLLDQLRGAGIVVPVTSAGAMGSSCAATPTAELANRPIATIEMNTGLSPFTGSPSPLVATARG